MGCATGIVRLLVFALNIACLLVGLVLIILGSVAIAAIDKIRGDELPVNQFIVAPGLMIALGSIVLLISFLGCCGACKSNSCMLTTVSCCCCCFCISHSFVRRAMFVNVCSFSTPSFFCCCLSLNSPSASTVTFSSKTRPAIRNSSTALPMPSSR